MHDREITRASAAASTSSQMRIDLISEKARIAECYRISGRNPSETEARLNRYRSALRASDYDCRQTTWASFLLEYGLNRSGCPTTQGIPAGVSL
jgi:hypothetical protein